MPHPILRDYTFSIYREKLLRALKPFMEDFKEKPGQINFTYEKYYRVRIISPSSGIGLRVQSEREGGFRVAKKLERIIFSCKINHKH